MTSSEVPARHRIIQTTRRLSMSVSAVEEARGQLIDRPTRLFGPFVNVSSNRAQRWSDTG
jgi:hypothetical protein